MRRYWKGILLLFLLSMTACFYNLKYIGNIGGYPPEPKARAGATKAKLADTMCAIEMFEQDTGQLPAEIGELIHTNGAPGWDGPYLKITGKLLDAWKRPVQYSKNAQRIELRSAGRDGRMNTTDDVIHERFLNTTPSPVSQPTNSLYGILLPQLNP